MKVPGNDQFPTFEELFFFGFDIFKKNEGELLKSKHFVQTLVRLKYGLKKSSQKDSKKRARGGGKGQLNLFQT